MSSTSTSIIISTRKTHEPFINGQLVTTKIMRFEAITRGRVANIGTSQKIAKTFLLGGRLVRANPVGSHRVTVITQLAGMLVVDYCFYSLSVPLVLFCLFCKTVEPPVELEVPAQGSNQGQEGSAGGCFEGHGGRIPRHRVSARRLGVTRRLEHGLLFQRKCDTCMHYVFIHTLDLFPPFFFFSFFCSSFWRLFSQCISYDFHKS